MAESQVTRRRQDARRRVKQIFTLKQAEDALPLVRRIVADIVGQYQQLEYLQRRRKKLLRQDRHEEVADLDRQAPEGVSRLNDLMDEANMIGCCLKDVELGLVDFHSIHEGREVLLCWKLGEESIEHWHEVDAGAAGRRPVVPSMRVL